MKRKLIYLTMMMLMALFLAACGREEKHTANNNVEEGIAEVHAEEACAEEVAAGKVETEKADTEKVDTEKVDTEEVYAEEDSDVHISCEIVETAARDTLADSAAYLGDLDAFGPVYLLTFDEAVTSVSLWELHAEIEDSGELVIQEKAALDSLGTVSAQEELYVYPGDVGETVPFKGISMVDRNGQTHHFYFMISGEDGSGIVEEYDFSS